ncbi:MAG: hypothetical protein ACR2GA_06645 [Chloroflexota bacterium]
MRKLVAGLLLAGVSLCGGLAPAYADGHTVAQQNTINWGRHDIAVYVVSTLNLMHTRRGHSMPGYLATKLSVQRYDVYADLKVANLYFIELKRGDGTTAGAFAYQMGWTRPHVLFLTDRHAGSHPTVDRISQAYRSDTKQLIGSFTSTMPQ